MTSLIFFFSFYILELSIVALCYAASYDQYDFSKLTEVTIAGICNIVASQNIENVSYL